MSGAAPVVTELKLRNVREACRRVLDSDPKFIGTLYTSRPKRDHRSARLTRVGSGGSSRSGGSGGRRANSPTLNHRTPMPKHLTASGSSLHSDDLPLRPQSVQAG
ncbi:hypothetical protein KIPB_014863, partial [Kipferlia bialata]|eukprot:g14863.t1